MTRIQILKTGITNLETDALVNAANEALREGAGVCGVIFKAAGSRELQAACDQIGRCATGSAVITPGFNLKSKYVIHAVGPRWKDGKHGEPELLYSAYTQSLLLAAQHGCKSIGFPLISAGIFGYPVDKAWRKALQACLDFQKENPDVSLDIRFAVIDDKILAIGKNTLAELSKETTALYLEQLKEKDIQSIKRKIQGESDLLIDKKAHPMAGGLLRVICDKNIMDILTCSQLIRVVESIFPSSVLDEGWLMKYSDYLLRIIDAAKKKKPDDRAGKYEKYLREVLVPALKAGAQSKDVHDDLETLIDIYKTTACLFRYYTKNEKDFIFDLTRDDMDQLNKSITNAKGAPVLGIVFVPVRMEDRQYSTFLSWVLEEFLCAQEGLGGDA